MRFVQNPPKQPAMTLLIAVLVSGLIGVHPEVALGPPEQLYEAFSGDIGKLMKCFIELRFQHAYPVKFLISL